MPRTAHRRMWRGEEDVLVLALVSPRGPFVLHSPNGEARVHVPQGSLNVPAEPLFVLQPAEYKGRRINPQANTPGDVIEDVTDGHSSVLMGWYGADGDSVVIDLSDADAGRQLAELQAKLEKLGLHMASTDGEQNLMMIPPSFCDENPYHPDCYEPLPPGPSDTTTIAAFRANFCDDDACFTNNEVRITGEYYNASGTFIGSGVVGHNVNPESDYYWNEPLLYYRVRQNTAEKVRVHLVETDSWPNSDDYCGYVDFNYANNGFYGYWQNAPPCTRAGYTWSARINLSWTPKY